MPTLLVETSIEAARQRCFDLARDVGVHCKTAAFTGERALPPGVTAGTLELGDTVVFEGRHLGIRQRLESRIVLMEPPARFADEMVSGVFKELYHLHEFIAVGDRTLMRDTLRWVSPLGPLGIIADVVIVERHLRCFLERRNRALKGIAEGL